MNDNKLNKILPLVVVLGILGYLIAANWETSVNIIIALLGFGLLVFVHELGHFLVARKNDVECEAFAIGMAIGTPFLFGVKKVQKGWRWRILPKTSGAKDDQAEEDCLAMFTVGSSPGAGDTEYCLGPLPIGGFVKMIGQDDSGPVDTAEDDNPRSYANKSVGARMAITSAGVLTNLFTAFIIFLALAFYGMERVPAIVGDVVPGMPAAQAGLKAGDEIIEINGMTRTVGGKSNLDFMHLFSAPVFSGDDPVEMTVKSPDGEIREFEIMPVRMPNGLKAIGVEKPTVLEIALVADQELYDKLGLQVGDEVFAVNGEPVESTNQFYDIIKDVYKPAITVSAKRQEKDSNSFEAVTTDIGLVYSSVTLINDEIASANVASLIPLLKVAAGDAVIQSDEENPDTEHKFLKGDVIIKVADVEYPSFLQFRDVTKEYEDKELVVEVLRSDEDGNVGPATVTVTPKMSEEAGRPIIGISFNSDMDSNIVSGSDRNDIPAGSRIVAVNGEATENFYDIIASVQRAEGEITVDYMAPHAQQPEKTVIALNSDDPVDMPKELAVPVPFDDYKRLYKAENPIQAFQMSGYLIADMFYQSISSIKGLFTKDLKADNLSGPVGIARLSYMIVQRKDFAYFLYFLAMISCFLAIFNFLPIPVVDGGHFVLLLIEKIKGSPVSFTVQKYLVYTGLVLIGALFIFITYNDIVKLIKGII